jgi:GntR family transcriptional regulator, transcriptional repressor for pyruvate dehydrogenase complex
MSSTVGSILARAGGDALARNGKLAETVAKRIVDDITEQGLAAGTKLPPERVMLERFGVSRGTLREALRILEVHGLLVIKSGPRGGPIVAEMTAADFNKACSLHFNAARITVEQLWSARLELEPMLARLAATNMPGNVREELGELVEAARGLEVADPAIYIKVGSAFHKLISDACGNPILSLFARSLGEMTAHLETGAVFPAESRDRVNQDHIDLSLAILAGDAEKAHELATVHMREIVATHAERYPGLLRNVLPYVI